MNLKALKTITLSRRERYYLMAGSAVVIIFLVFQFALFPFMDARDRTKRSIDAAEATLSELVVLSAEYQSMRGTSRELSVLIEGRRKDFSLFSFLEQEAGNAGIKPNISYMRPSETLDRGPYREFSVEMRLENITMTQLVEYLHRVESRENLVSVRRISIKRTDNPQGFLSVLIQLVTVA